MFYERVMSQTGEGKGWDMMKEEDLASIVVSWLEDQHWEVFQEVDPKQVEGIADIVAKTGNFIWVIECKTSLSLELLEQAYMWKHFAHFISVAVPAAKRRTKGRRVAGLFLEHSGLGKINVSSSGKVSVGPSAKIHRRVRSEYITNSLHEQQKTFARAGNANGHRWTPFAETCLRLESYVRNNPGTTLAEAMMQIGHHYASDKTAVSSISFHLRHNPGLIKGIELRKEGRHLKLYPEK